MNIFVIGQWIKRKSFSLECPMFATIITCKTLSTNSLQIFSSTRSKSSISSLIDQTRCKKKAQIQIDAFSLTILLMRIGRKSDAALAHSTEQAAIFSKIFIGRSIIETILSVIASNLFSLERKNSTLHQWKTSTLTREFYLLCPTKWSNVFVKEEVLFKWNSSSLLTVKENSCCISSRKSVQSRDEKHRGWCDRFLLLYNTPHQTKTFLLTFHRQWKRETNSMLVDWWRRTVVQWMQVTSALCSSFLFVKLNQNETIVIKQQIYHA